MKDIKIISILNGKYNLSTYLGTDIVKDYLQSNGHKAQCLSYWYDLRNHYGSYNKKKREYAVYVAEIGDLDDILTIVKNFREGKENLTEGLNLDQFEIDIINDIKNEAEKIELTNNTIIGFSIVYASYLFSILFSFYLRRRKPDIKIVFGGYHVTLSKNVQEFSIKCGAADFSVSGCGCIPMLDIANDKIEGGIIKGKFLTSNPWPKYNKIERHIRKGSFPTISSVGCLFDCHFCASKRDLVLYDLDELGEYLKKQHKIRKFEFADFADDCINSTIVRALDLCSVMKIVKKETEFFNWGGHFACNNSSEELISELSNSGCKVLFIGTETFSDSILKDINKKCSSEKYIESAHHLCEKGIKVSLGLITGMPGETNKMAEDTRNIVRSLVKKHKENIEVVPTVLKIFPGSRMYNNPNEFGITFTKWDNKYIDMFPDLSEIISRIPKTFQIDGIKIHQPRERMLKLAFENYDNLQHAEIDHWDSAKDELKKAIEIEGEK